jgi:penicillin-binding protein 2
MKVSCRCSIALVFLGISMGVAGAGALDAPPSSTVHRVRTKEAYLSETHPAAAHAAAAKPRTTVTAAHKPAMHAATTPVARRRAAAVTPLVKTTITAGARIRKTAVVHPYYERFTASSFVKGAIGTDDITAGEDPVVRQAAIDALGGMNGTAVVIDPSNGRILAMVNQKLALSPGAEPCSTIKLTVALAALSEGLVTRDTPVQLAGFRMNMTQALAKSNNLYFEEMGRELGFDRVRHYATQFGLGELAGYHIDGEQLGEYPDKAIPASEGGVGRMCSFGQGVSLTPLQLGALVAAIANGGTLYYLQHPTSAEEVAAFEPHVKRTLDIARYIPDMQDGMAGAVEYGTARSLRAKFQALPVFGKTGTCSNLGAHLGWFGSYSNSSSGPLVTVFFFEGTRGFSGPFAAGITGVFYKNLAEHNYFGNRNYEASSDAGPTRTTAIGAAQ